MRKPVITTRIDGRGDYTVDGNLGIMMPSVLWWQVDLGRMVPVNEVIFYRDTSYFRDVVVRVGKVAKYIDIYLFCFQLTRKKRKYICTVTIPFMKDSIMVIFITLSNFLSRNF